MIMQVGNLKNVYHFVMPVKGKLTGSAGEFMITEATQQLKDEQNASIVAACMLT